MIEPVIEVEDLGYTYARGREPAVRDISFQIARGEIFGFLGPSGAGKSTTQNILIGLLEGYSGRVKVLGRDLTTWGHDFYERIGVSFERPNHFQKLSARENLDFFRRLYRSETEEPMHLLDIVGLTDDADTRVSRFSKGMQVRLTFARSLLNRPEILFLDEPTAGLDPGNARRVKDIIASQRDAGRSVFLTTHNMTVADELCDRVAFLVGGEIVLVDAPRVLKVARGTRRVRVEFQLDHEVAEREFPLDDLGTNEAFLTLLRERSIETIHSGEPTLEDVFIQVTGRSLE